MTKVSQASVKYTDHGSKEEHCSNCGHYVNPTTCEVVVGKIRPEGWCERWKAKS